MTAADPNLSGINLSRPSDSGINLQAAAASTWARPTRSSWPRCPTTRSRRIKADAATAQAGRQGQPGKAKPSLAATPPPAVKKGEKDIFDDTDFEVDVPLSDDDSDDKTVQLEAVSDFDLEESDSGSEVFAIDEEDVDQNAATAMAPSAFAEERRGGRRLRGRRLQRDGHRLVVRTRARTSGSQPARPW